MADWFMAEGWRGDAGFFGIKPDDIQVPTSNSTQSVSIFNWGDGIILGCQISAAASFSTLQGFPP